MFESSLKGMSGRETTGHFTSKSSCSAVEPRHLLLVAEGHDRKGGCFGLSWALTTMTCLARGGSGLCPPGTEVEDGERESKGTGM